MLRRLILTLLLLVPASKASAADDVAGDITECACDLTPASCDASCACDSECEVDWSIDECTQPGADCLPDAREPEDAELDVEEVATPDDEVIAWVSSPADVVCPDGGAKDAAGHCQPVAGPTEIAGGCSSGRTAGLAIGVAVFGLLVVRRRRRAVFALALAAACSIDATGWDQAVEAGPTGDTDTYLDVYAAPLGDGGEASQFLLLHQSLAPGSKQPVAQLSLSRVISEVGIYRVASTHGDRLTSDPEPGDAELLGWARASAGDGTAELVELQARDGSFVYETAGESIDSLVTAGYTITNRLGYVWPPGISDPVVADDEPADVIAAPAPCRVSTHSATRSALVLLYASPGADLSDRFLKGCPGEVVIGEKRESGPVGRFRTTESKGAGGRTGFVLDRHGDKLRSLLLRANGVERTRAYLKKKLAIGYDYIVIDEITAAPDFRDGTTLNRRLRKLMQRMPARTIIPYISIDLTQQVGGFEASRARRLLLRSFKLRARALALEIYLHTPEVMAGAAPSVYRRAADRLALAVSGLPRAGGINLRAISVVGTSMHSSLAQYRYLDQPAHDLASITRQVNAIRHGSKRLRQQNGIGYYFVNKSDMAPRSGAPYSYEGLIRRLRLQALRFR